MKGEVCVDLDYEEDSTAEVDMNIVATGDGQLVEVQGTAEKASFDARSWTPCWTPGWWASRKLIEAQKKVLGVMRLLFATTNAGKLRELRGAG